MATTRFTVVYRLEKRNDGDWDTWSVIDVERGQDDPLCLSYTQADAVVIAAALNAMPTQEPTPPPERADGTEPKRFQLKVVR
jgi:hypothetical protein